MAPLPCTSLSAPVTDDVYITQEVSFEETQVRARINAVNEGRFIDLTNEIEEPPRLPVLQANTALFVVETICSTKGVTKKNARTKKKITTEMLKMMYVNDDHTLIVFIESKIEQDGYYVSPTGKVIVGIKNK